MSTNELIAKFIPKGHLFSSTREKIIHAMVWLATLILVNIPSFELTMGVFYSGDLSLLVPSLYGIVLNSLLFYTVAEMVVNHFRSISIAFLWQVLLLFTLILGVESVLDILYDYFFYRKSFSEVGEILLSNLILNTLPFLLAGLVYGILKGWKIHATNDDIKITIKDGNRTIYYEPREIVVIESDANYVKYTTTNAIVLERNSLNNVEKSLPPQFLRCHRSFIINTDQIDKISASNIVLGNLKIPIGRKYKEDLKNKLNLK